MLRSVKDLRDATIGATNGDIGKVDQFLFDDKHWTIRYMVANTGDWLVDQLVLISPMSIQQVDWEHGRVQVNLTREKVEHAPGISTNEPVSRQKEEQFAQYYQYTPYWYGTGLWGTGMYPSMLGQPGVAVPAVAAGGSDEQTQTPDAQTEENHLRSTSEVLHYHIQATDDEIGHVDDFVMDDETWQIRYMVVDTSNWWFGKKVLVAPEWITNVDWSSALVDVNMARDQIKNGPEFDPSMLNREYEERLHRHYGRRGYWEK